MKIASSIPTSIFHGLILVNEDMQKVSPSPSSNTGVRALTKKDLISISKVDKVTHVGESDEILVYFFMPRYGQNL